MEEKNVIEVTIEPENNLFKSIFKDSDKFETPDILTVEAFIAGLLWGKKRKVSDFVMRGDDCLRGEVGGGWRRISDKPIPVEQVAKIINEIDTPTSTASLDKGHDIDRRYAPIEIIAQAGTRVKERISHRFRINITQIKSPISDDISYELTIRTLPSDPPLPHVLGLETEFLDNFFKKNSMSLVTGGTGNGKSTLLYSIFAGWVKDGETQRTGLRILDYCKPIEYVINNTNSETFISQTEVGEMLMNFDDRSESGQWQYSGRNAVRRRPDVINIGETRDRPTFDSLMTASNTGHFATTTMHNNSCPSALQRGLRFYGFEERLGVGSDLMSYLNCIVNQELVLGSDGKTRYALREYIIINDIMRARILNESNVERWPGMLHQIMVDNAQRSRRDERLGISQTKYEHALRRFEAGEIGESVVSRMREQLYGMNKSLETIGSPKAVMDRHEIQSIDDSIARRSNG